MDNKKLSFLDDGQSIALTVSQLHSYFENTCSTYQIKHGQLINKIRSSQEERSSLYQEELERLSEEISLFSVLRDALSIADNLLHSSTMIKAIGADAEVFQIHQEDEAEQARERELTQKRMGITE